MMRRILITLDDEAYGKLEARCAESYSPSQMAKQILLKELGMATPKNEPPLVTLIEELDRFVKNNPGKKMYILEPFADRWHLFDTGTKRALSWHLRKLEKSGYCKKLEENQLNNGTHQYQILEQKGDEK